MPTATLQVETYGSHLFIDEFDKVYLRVPKTEGPRAPGPHGEDWGGPGADPGLQDLTWHPYTMWRLREGLLDVVPHRLIIGLGYDETRCTSFPLPEHEFHRLQELAESA